MNRPPKKDYERLFVYPCIHIGPTIDFDKERFPEGSDGEKILGHLSHLLEHLYTDYGDAIDFFKKNENGKYSKEQISDRVSWLSGAKRAIWWVIYTMNGRYR